MKPTKRDTRQFKLDMLGHNLQTLNLVVHGCFCCWLVSWSNPCYHGMLPKELMLGWWDDGLPRFHITWWCLILKAIWAMVKTMVKTTEIGKSLRNRWWHGMTVMVGASRGMFLTMAQKREHIPWIVELISNQNELFLLFTRLLSWSPGISWLNVSSSGVLQTP